MRHISTRPGSRALLTVAIVSLLESAKPLLLPVVIAVAFTFVLAAPVRSLRRHGLPDHVGAARASRAPASTYRAES